MVFYLKSPTLTMLKRDIINHFLVSCVQEQIQLNKGIILRST